MAHRLTFSSCLYAFNADDSAIVASVRVCVCVYVCAHGLFGRVYAVLYSLACSFVSYVHMFTS